MILFKTKKFALRNYVQKNKIKISCLYSVDNCENDLDLNLLLDSFPKNSFETGHLKVLYGSDEFLCSRFDCFCILNSQR